MWKYNNIKFVYANRVGSKFGEGGVCPSLTIYIKSNYALMQALRFYVAEADFGGDYTDIDPRTVTHDKPIKV